MTDYTPVENLDGRLYKREDLYRSGRRDGTTCFWIVGGPL